MWPKDLQTAKSITFLSKYIRTFILKSQFKVNLKLQALKQRYGCFSAQLKQNC